MLLQSPVHSPAPWRRSPCGRRARGPSQPRTGARPPRHRTLRAAGAHRAHRHPEVLGALPLAVAELDVHVGPDFGALQEHVHLLESEQVSQCVRVCVCVWVCVCVSKQEGTCVLRGGPSKRIANAAEETIKLRNT
jgi:hypothetical protein